MCSTCILRSIYFTTECLYCSISSRYDENSVITSKYHKNANQRFVLFVFLQVCTELHLLNVNLSFPTFIDHFFPQLPSILLHFIFPLCPRSAIHSPQNIAVSVFPCLPIPVCIIFTNSSFYISYPRNRNFLSKIIVSQVIYNRWMLLFFKTKKIINSSFRCLSLQRFIIYKILFFLCMTSGYR